MENNQNKSPSSFRAYMIEAILFFTYAFFAVNWIAGSTLTAQIAAFSVWTAVLHRLLFPMR